MSDDPGYRRLVTNKGHIIRMQEIEIDIPKCESHPAECIQKIPDGVWKGTVFCTKCRTVIKVDESSWRNGLQAEEEPTS